MKAASRPRDAVEARRRLLVSLAIAVLVHGALLIVLLQVSRARRAPPVENGSAIRLRLIDARVPERQDAATPVRDVDPEQIAAPERDATQRAPRPMPESASSPESEPPPMATAASRVPARLPAEATPAVSADASPLRLYKRDGSLSLPDADHEAIAQDPAAFGRRARAPAYTPDPMAHRSPLPYEPTRFERYWTPRDEDLLDEWVRRATRTTSWDTEGGTRITCSAFLFFGGCGWGPAPRVPIEELKRMRADPPLPRPSPLRSESSAGQ